MRSLKVLGLLWVAATVPAAFMILTGCDGGDGSDSDDCALTGKHTLQFQLATSSDENCLDLPDQSVDFDDDDEESDECDTAVNKETCTGYVDCADPEGLTMKMTFNAKDNEVAGSVDVTYPVDDQGNTIECTYLISTK